MDVYPDLMV